MKKCYDAYCVCMYVIIECFVFLYGSLLSLATFPSLTPPGQGGLMTG